MKISPPDLPGWLFEVDEMSANVFKVIGRDKAGRTIEKTGLDPDVLLEECKASARTMSSSTNLHS